MILNPHLKKIQDLLIIITEGLSNYFTYFFPVNFDADPDPHWKNGSGPKYGSRLFVQNLINLTKKNLNLSDYFAYLVSKT